MPIFEDEFKRGKRSNYIAGPAEKISDYFQKSMPKNSLQKIFSSYQLQQTIEKELGEKVKVVLKNSAINIVCSSPAQATSFKMRMRKLYAITSRYFDGKQVIKISVKFTQPGRQ